MDDFNFTQKYIDDLTYKIIGAAIEVHRELGPGLLESVYERCLAHLLTGKKMRVARQQKVLLKFRDIHWDCDLRLDLLIEEAIILEIKAVEVLLPIHEAQLLTYLKLLNKSKGILINFNCRNIFMEGQKTLVTDFYSKLPRG